MGGSRQTSSGSSSAGSTKPKERYIVWMKQTRRIYTYAYSAKQAKHFAKYRLRGYTPTRAAKDPPKSVSGSEKTSSRGTARSKSTKSSVKRKVTTKEAQKNTNNNNNNKKTTKAKSPPAKKKTGATKKGSSSLGSASTKSNPSSSKAKTNNKKKTIPPLKKNALGQYGYKLNKNQSERIKALKKAVKGQGYKSIVSRLVATANLTKTSQPQNHKKYRSDIRQLQNLYGRN